MLLSSPLPLPPPSSVLSPSSSLPQAPAPVRRCPSPASLKFHRGVEKHRDNCGMQDLRCYSASYASSSSAATGNWISWWPATAAAESSGSLRRGSQRMGWIREVGWTRLLQLLLHQKRHQKIQLACHSNYIPTRFSNSVISAGGTFSMVTIRSCSRKCSLSGDYTNQALNYHFLIIRLNCGRHLLIPGHDHIEVALPSTIVDVVDVASLIGGALSHLVA